MQLRHPSALRRVCAAGCALLALASSPTLASADHAEAPSDRTKPQAPFIPLAAPSPDLPGLHRTSVELADVTVAGTRFERASADYRDVDAAHTAARDRRAELDRAATELRGQARQLELTRGAAEARVAGLTSRLSSVEAAVQRLAVRTFVAGGDDERLTEAMASEAPAINDVERRDVLGGAAMEVLLAERAAYVERLDEATARAQAASEDLIEARRSLEQITADRARAVADEIAAGGHVATARVAYEDARALAEVDGVDFPLVALDAYYRAATTISAERPSCRVQWWGLAGISRVEGRHGTYGGASLEPNGDTSRRIIGIQLDGTTSAQVADTDGGAYDGDPLFDRAVGPMQFIPQTWSRFQADGNDDGTSSPFNLYDATLAAAGYLCTASSGLDGDAGLRAAYFSYNHSEAYVDAVLGYAHLYQDAIDVPEPAI
jgi:membrane-bound lytic murein transglycosylase B